MSCCGKKRESLNYTFEKPEDRLTEPRTIDRNNFQKSEPGEKRFRYTGTQSLSIKSFSNRRKYHFSVESPIQVVLGEDVAMMRGYSELKELEE